MRAPHEKTPWSSLALVCIAVLMVGILCSCSPRIAGPGIGQGGHAAALTWEVTEWLALFAGFAAIVVAVVFAFLKEYTAGITASLGCMGLCALFLVLPAVVSFIKWGILAVLVLTVGGVCYLAVTRIRHPNAALPSLIARMKPGKGGKPSLPPNTST